MRGSVRRHGKGWQVRINGIPDGNGGRRQLGRSAPTKAAADELLRKLLTEYGDGIIHNGDATVAQLLADWMQLKAKMLGVNTLVDYRSIIKVHLPDTLKATKVWKVRTHDIDRLYLNLANAGLGPARIQRVDTVLRGAFGQAVRWQWIARNPVLEASRPPVRRGKPVAPELDEVRHLLAAADDSLLLYVRLSAHLGARRGEMCALQWADFDLAIGEVRISRALADGGRGVGIVSKTTKTDRERRIAIAPTVLAELNAYRRARLRTALELGTPLQPTSYLFSNDAAGIAPWRPDRATKLFDDLRTSLDLRHVKLKNLRHFVFTQMLAAGVDVRTVAGRAGHARTSTTLDFYGAWVPANDRSAADVLEQRLG